MKYGPEKIIQWFDRSDGSERYFSSQFRKVYGVRSTTHGASGSPREEALAGGESGRIRAYPLTPLDPLSGEVLGSVSRSFFDRDRNRLYAAVNRPGRPAQIVSIDLSTGQLTTLTEVVVPALYYVTSLA